MQGKSIVSALAMLLILVQACSPSPTEVAQIRTTAMPPTQTASATNPPSVPTQPASLTTQVAQPTLVPTEVPKQVTDIIFEINHYESTASVADWTSNQGCTPNYGQITPGVAVPKEQIESHLKVAPDGTLEGTCKDDYGEMRDTGSLTGKIDWESGEITFHMEGRSDYLQSGISTTVTIVLEGKGKVTGSDGAAGEVQWSLQCRAGATGGRTCDAPGSEHELSLDVTGSTPWKMFFVRQ